MFHSQHGQDKFIFEKFFKDKKNGIFLEIGADDGIRFSNCKFFETYMNWVGIAIEARECAYNKLKKNRKCICLNTVLSDKKETTEFLELEGYGIGLSGLVNKYDPRHVERIGREILHPEHKGRKTITVNTTKLNEILDTYKMKKIDFLSIDTEGSELDILSTLDFDIYKIDVITIEDNFNDPKLMEFFIKRGYEFITSIDCDKIFKKILKQP